MSCRFMTLDLDVHYFKLLTCSYCYIFLFGKDSQLYLNGTNLQAGSDGYYKYSYPSGSFYRADLGNATMVSQICEPLQDRGCTKWTTCCQEAVKCCERQRKIPATSSNYTHCPRTWDGYGCFDDTAGGETAYITCPMYVDPSPSDATAYKVCWPNGTWYKHEITKRHWTNYSTCIDIKDQSVLVYVSLGCNVVSLMLLIPSCTIFLVFRQLRVQQRVRLHICFFTSFIFTAIITSLWDFIVHHDALTTRDRESSVMKQNSAGCKILYSLLRYTQCSNYFWMFCEGFYLHRLIVHAFKVPKSLSWYYAFAWGLAWVPISIYAIIRATMDKYDKSCWVHHMNGFEWLIYTPNLLCLFANVFFLGNILRILLTQLQSHPNEPSGYRRALKATFVLIPLFGIQWSLVLYRVPNSLWYEILRIVIQNSQGAFVSLIFCMFNGEVHSHLKTCMGRLSGRGLYRGFQRDGVSVTSGTLYTQVRTSTAQEFNHDSVPLNHKDDSLVFKQENGSLETDQTQT